MLDRSAMDGQPKLSRSRAVVIGRRRVRRRAGSQPMAPMRNSSNAALSSRRRLVRQRLLTALNRLISASLDMDDVLKAIARAAATLMGAAVASFWVVDEETQTLELRAFSNDVMGAGQTFRNAQFGQGSAGWVAA